MPLPTVNDLHVDGVRTELSIAFQNERKFLAADAIAPFVMVDKQSDLYATWSQADWMRIQVQEVADGAPAPILSHGVSTSAYFCKSYAGKKLVTDKQRANARNEFELDKATIAFLTHQMLLKREHVVATNFWTTGVWGTDKTPGTKWSASSSDPFGDLRVGCRAIQTATGYWPTDLVLGSDVWDTLADHADTLDRIKYTEKGVVTPDLLASALDLKRVTIAAATYNSSSAGAAASMTQLYDPNDALLIYRPDSPEQFVPSAAYTFAWSEFDMVRDGAASIKTWREDDPSGEWFKAEMAFDPKVTASAAGYFFNEATS